MILYLLVPLGEVNILLVLDTDLDGTGGGSLLLGLGSHLVDLGGLGGLGGSLGRGSSGVSDDDGGGGSFYSS